MKLDILAFGAHPDDVEFSASGTICKAIASDKKVGIVDLTRGELGTRGSAEIRDQESAKASQTMGIHIRENLGFRDGFFKNDEEHQLAVIKMIRMYQPDIILTNSDDGRHPDHARGEILVRHAAFLSGLAKIETGQERWRPQSIFQYIHGQHVTPDFVVDITDFYDQKIQAIKDYKSQFYDPDNKQELETVLTRPEFWDFVEMRAKEYGHFIDAKYGEGFLVKGPLKVNQLTDLL